MMIVDSNEKNPNIIRILNENGVPTEIKQLPVGDYLWNNIIVERKSISDFVSSISNNHLFDQLDDIIYNLSINDARGVLAMYGNLNDLEWRYLKFFSIPIFYKHIGEILAHYPEVDFFWLENEEAFAIFLSAFYHQSYTRKKPHLNFVKKTKRDDVNCLIASKHFSVAQAKRILKEYSLRQIFNLNLKDMVKIKGFGEIGVKKFLKFRGKK